VEEEGKEEDVADLDDEGEEEEEDTTPEGVHSAHLSCQK